MNGLLVIIIGMAVTGMAWAVVYALSATSAGKKRHLQQRLRHDVRTDDSSFLKRPLTLRDQAEALPGFLAHSAFIQKLQRRIAQAYPEVRVSRFMFLVIAFALIPFTLIAFTSDSPVLGAVAGVGAGYLPFFAVARKRKKRQRAIVEQLPEALDFLSRVLRAGQSFSTAVQMIATEQPGALGAEFRRCYDQHSLGQSLEDGLREMSIRIDSTDFAFFVTAVIIQRQTGGDLAEVLQNITAMIRKRIRLAQSVKSKTAEGRFTGYIMIAFPMVMFGLAWLVNPEYGQVLLHTSLGLKLLGLAGLLQLIGLFLIRKITAVQV